MESTARTVVRTRVRVRMLSGNCGGSWVLREFFEGTRELQRTYHPCLVADRCERSKVRSPSTISS